MGECEHCGANISRKNAVYCSVACKDKHAEICTPDEELVSLYNNGFSTNQLGKKYGISYGTIRNRLIRCGVELRKKTDHMVSNNHRTGMPVAPDVKAKIAEGVKKYASDPEVRQRLSEQAVLRNTKGSHRKVSKIEDLVAAELDKLRIYYERQKPVRDKKSGRYCCLPDFLMGDVVLEVNGTFWHADPRRYPDGPVTYTQKVVAKAYAKKVALLIENNYSLKEVWEMDIRENTAMAVKKALGFQ